MLGVVYTILCKILSLLLIYSWCTNPKLTHQKKEVLVLKVDFHVWPPHSPGVTKLLKTREYPLDLPVQSIASLLLDTLSSNNPNSSNHKFKRESTASSPLNNAKKKKNITNQVFWTRNPTRNCEDMKVQNKCRSSSWPCRTTKN